MKKYPIAGGTTAILGAVLAFAFGSRVAAAPMSFDWSGFYFGVNGGYAWGSTLYSWPIFGGAGDFAPEFTGGRFRQDLQGGVYGGHFGYNLQFANWVFGLEASLDGSDISGHSADQFPSIVGPVTYDARLKWLGSMTPRLGYSTGNWLFYGKGGIAAGEVRTRLFNLNDQDLTSQNNDHIGWTLGGGIEYALTPNWIFGLEYNYYVLRDQLYGGVVTRNGVVINDLEGEYHLDPKFSTVLARLTYKPGDPHPLAVASTRVAKGTWDGSYAGIHAGYGWGNTDYSWPVGGDDLGAFAPFGGGSFRQDLKGGIYGGHFGYNAQFNNWVFGLETSFDGSGIRGQSGDHPAFVDSHNVNPGATYNAKLQWFGSVTPRVGYATGSSLIYVKAGAAAGEMRTLLTGNGIFGPESTGQHNDHVGWTAGTGIEYELTPVWVIGLEYDYFDLGDQLYGGVIKGAHGGFGNPNEYHLNPKFNTTLVRLSYKFGEP